MELGRYCIAVSRENVDLTRRLYASWERGDFSPQPDLFDPDVEFFRQGGDLDAAGLVGEWRGADETGEAMRDWMHSWDKLRIKGERFHDLGDRVLVLDRHIGVGKRSGVSLDHQMGHVVTLCEGRIVRWEGYWDPSDALRAAGLSE
jgi:ketosteroid isomerase-like protein